MMSSEVTASIIANVSSTSLNVSATAENPSSAWTAEAELEEHSLWLTSAAADSSLSVLQASSPALSSSWLISSVPIPTMLLDNASYSGFQAGSGLDLTGTMTADELAIMDLVNDFRTNALETYRQPLTVVLMVVYGVVFILSLTGNGLVLLVVLGNRSMRTTTNYFLLNLSIADLLGT